LIHCPARAVKVITKFEDLSFDGAARSWNEFE